ncbi:MAG TPA: hypothetical protein VK722_03950 [Candidatus Aquilonibacter sp.]|nr:hypothetical protein [Candidatus Aquilonibacter sp.]
MLAELQAIADQANGRIDTKRRGFTTVEETEIFVLERRIQKLRRTMELPVMTHCTCPHRGEETSIGSAASFETILMTRRMCVKCGKQFLIVSNVPMTEAQYLR